MKTCNSTLSTISRDLMDEADDIQDKSVNIYISEKVKVKDQFVLMFISNFQRLLEILTQRELKVLMCIVKYAEFKNVFRITQKTIEKETKIKQSNISVILNKLREKNFLLVDEENGIEYVNPYLFLKGTIKEFKGSDLYKQLYNKDFDNIKNPF